MKFYAILVDLYKNKYVNRKLKKGERVCYINIIIVLISQNTLIECRGRRGCDRMVVGFIPVQLVPKVVSLNPPHGEVYLIKHYEFNQVLVMGKFNQVLIMGKFNWVLVMGKFNQVLVMGKFNQVLVMGKFNQVLVMGKFNQVLVMGLFCK
jgi:hypothetical protein